MVLTNDVYPSITFCLLNPFIERKLGKYNKNLTVREYKTILRGRCDIGRLGVGNKMVDKDSIWCDKLKWSQSFLDIDYDEVTFNLNDILQNFILFFLTNDVTRNHEITFVMENDSLRLDYWVNAKDYGNLKEINYSVPDSHNTNVSHLIFRLLGENIFVSWT